MFPPIDAAMKFKDDGLQLVDSSKIYHRILLKLSIDFPSILTRVKFFLLKTDKLAPVHMFMVNIILIRQQFDHLAFWSTITLACPGTRIFYIYTYPFQNPIFLFRKHFQRSVPIPSLKAFLWELFLPWEISLCFIPIPGSFICSCRFLRR